MLLQAGSEGPPLIFRAAWLHLAVTASACLRGTLIPEYLGMSPNVPDEGFVLASYNYLKYSAERKIRNNINPRESVLLNAYFWLIVSSVPSIIFRCKIAGG